MKYQTQWQRKWLAGLASMCLAVFASAAWGEVTFRYATDQSSYLVAPGGSVDVVVMLIEERSSDQDASILLQEDGVIGWDARVSRESGSAMITGALVNMDVFSFPFADTVNPNPIPLGGSTSIDFAASAFDMVGPAGEQDGLIRKLILGTVTIAVPDSPVDPLEISMFSVGDSQLGSNTVTNGFSVLDAQIQPASFTIQVPEPTCLGLVSGIALLACRRRRR